MSSAAKTRAARVAQGMCSACLQRPASPGHATCEQCRGDINAGTKELYTARRGRGECVRCGKRTGPRGDARDPMLCDDHATERRKRRADAKKPTVGGTPAPDLPRAWIVRRRRR